MMKTEDSVYKEIILMKAKPENVTGSLLLVIVKVHGERKKSMTLYLKSFFSNSFCLIIQVSHPTSPFCLRPQRPEDDVSSHVTTLATLADFLPDQASAR